MLIGELGRKYEDNEIVVKQGDAGNEMYVVQEGRLDVLVDGVDGKIVLSHLDPGDIFGEMALFTHSPRSATVVARGAARVLTIDKRGFFKRVQEDPSIAFHILEKMSERIQKLDDEIAHLRKARSG